MINDAATVLEHDDDRTEEGTEKIVSSQDIKPLWRHAFPVKNWERFEFKKLLGYGGMGIVYQARDVKLDRLVALKFLRNNGRISSQRFLLEARAQCRIEHPNVCKVYEAGEVEDMPYIAMQYIDGRPLRKVYKEMTLEEKVKVMHDMTLGIQAAHKLGIIHRDIKPDNVMIIRGEDGQWQPIVMDFGLAKEVGHQGLTESGMVMGTPAYMSPEQASGHINLLDRRADIYSLGATFYTILVEKPPFEGANAMEVVLKVINEEAQSISQLVPSLPLDLNTIIMKCLEKDPKQRYDSAQILAHDLQQYLNGEPISAQATSWTTKLRRKARKNRTLVTLGSIALTLVLMFGSIALWTWWQSARIAELARELGEQVIKIEAMMRFAALTAPHDISAERQLARQEMQAIEGRMAAVGSLAHGPGNYALGRSYLALCDYEKARAHLESAYRTGFRTPGLHFALGQVLGECYRRELDSLPQIEDKEAREEQMERLEQEYLQPIKLHLTAYLQSKSDRSAQETAYLEGLVALYGKDYETALKQAKAAQGQSSWFYEAHWLEGETYLMWYRTQARAGKVNEAKDLLVKAEAAFTQASKIAPSDLRSRLGLARKHVMAINFIIYKGRSIEEDFEKAIAASDQTLQIDPDNNEAAIIKTSSYYRLGEYKFNKGDDPRATMSQAIAWAKIVTAKDPMEAKGFRFMGSAYRILGRYALQNGEDPRSLLTLAVTNLQQAIKIKPSYATSYNTLGLVYGALGQYEENNGGDPRPYFQLSAESFHKAIQTFPNYANAMTTLGRLYKDLGDYEREHGGEPEPFYQQALANLRKAIELNPNYPYAYTNLGTLYQARAVYEWERGADPRSSLDLAAESLHKAVALNAKYFNAYNALAQLYEIRSRYEMAQGQDPRAAFALALESVDKAIELNPKHAEIYNIRGLVYYSQLDYELQSGSYSKELFDQARASFQQSLEINPKHFLSPLYMARLYGQQGRWQLTNAENPDANLQESRRWLAQSLAINPDYQLSLRTQAEIEQMEAKKH